MRCTGLDRAGRRQTGAGTEDGISCLFFFFWLHCMVCRILVPQPGIEPSPLCVRLWGPNHWTTREFPLVVLLDTGSVVPGEGAGQTSSTWDSAMLERPGGWEGDEQGCSHRVGQRGLCPCTHREVEQSKCTAVSGPCLGVQT